MGRLSASTAGSFNPSPMPDQPTARLPLTTMRMARRRRVADQASAAVTISSTLSALANSRDASPSVSARFWRAGGSAGASVR